ncbi:hypothetical protein GCM10022415_05960 [Knoellia locipacati]|uniref:Uncharacterized protein n=1 Tax=Knoellia locipacati TaxID=882824 RepID=A0A512SX74_9MICO|nr:hypothetical protein [Knoellia locipacati]GEQ12547.1 hypothetical protein KLO01_05940 [Knoellia locipacati]
MNDTVSMATGPAAAEVRDYVARVRAALADLPVEDVEEFTTGMEADLAERLAEPGEGTLRDRVGDPDAYAAELRSAAGLPPRVAGDPARVPAGERISARWSRLSAQVLEAAPWLSDLRPVWWFVRGVALAALPAVLVGASIVWLGAIGAVVSVALGLLARHGHLNGGWVGPVRVVGNLLAVLLLPVAFLLLVDGHDPYANEVYGDEPVSSGSGVTSNGEQVTNLYAYDETGRRLDKVRLLDQNGRALEVGEDFVWSTDDPGALDALRDPRTGELTIPRDVFPLRWDDRTGWERMGDGTWEPPLAITPLPGPVPVVENDGTPTPTPTTSPTVLPTPSPTAPQTSPSTGVSATPTPTPSASPSASR